MVVALPLTHWADPNLDPKLRSPKLLPLSRCCISFDTTSRQATLSTLGNCVDTNADAKQRKGRSIRGSVKTNMTTVGALVTQPRVEAEIRLTGQGQGDQHLHHRHHDNHHHLHRHWCKCRATRDKQRWDRRYTPHGGRCIRESYHRWKWLNDDALLMEASASENLIIIGRD